MKACIVSSNSFVMSVVTRIHAPDPADGGCDKMALKFGLRLKHQLMHALLKTFCWDSGGNRLLFGCLGVSGAGFLICRRNAF